MQQKGSIQNAGSLVNKLGKYLKSKLDGAFKIKFGPMYCDVTLTMYYQIPGESDTFKEMNFIINITSYQNKIRVNLTEDTPMEKTIGQVILTDSQLADFNEAEKAILNKLKKSIEKEYADFDFVF